MLFGMLGIFLVMGIIIWVVSVLKLFSGSGKKEKGPEDTAE